MKKARYINELERLHLKTRVLVKKVACSFINNLKVGKNGLTFGLQFAQSCSYAITDLQVWSKC